MSKTALYPPSPVDVPDDLTEVSASFRQQTLHMLLAVAIFFLIYFGLMALCVLFLAWCAFGSWNPRNGALIGLRVVLAIPCALLLLFLVKNLFHWGGREKTYDIEIFPEEHPRFFDFVDTLCEETGAPKPTKVYVNFEVNAMASRDSSFWHLFFPSNHYLHIGLGLANAINLTEFKALLAHEFGHFSQKSRRLHLYSGYALDTIHNIVNGYDWFDRFLDAWLGLHIVLSWPAWIFFGLQWVFKKALVGMMYVIFYFLQAHRREMEFHADLVAVSVTGSDAPVHLLHRCIFAEHCLSQAIAELQDAMDHHLYTNDMFFHQTNCQDFIRKKKRRPSLGKPPLLPDDPEHTTQVFQPDDDEQAAMWESHPSNYEREQNAKEFYLRSEFDERSPWLLFDSQIELKERVTFKFYRFHFKVPKDVVLAEAQEIQEFIDDERSEIHYDARFQGLYDFRNLMLEDVYEWARDAKSFPWNITEIAQSHRNLYDVEVKHRAQLFNTRLREVGELRPIARGWHKPKNDEFDFRGELRDVRDAKKLVKKVEKELDRDCEWLKEFDRKVFFTFFQMGLHLGQDVAEELFIRYRFHGQMQKIWQSLQDQEYPLNQALAFLQDQRTGQMGESDFREILSMLREAHVTLRDSLRNAEEMTFPPLKNLPAGQPVRPFLLRKKLVAGLTEYDMTIRFNWITKFVNQLDEVKKKVDRIHYKSLGGILILQDRIGIECLNKWSKLPVVQSF